MKKPYYSGNSFELFGCLIAILIWMIPAALISFWTHSNINQWLVFAEKETECPFWLSFICSLFFGPTMIALNIISEILQLFVF